MPSIAVTIIYASTSGNVELVAEEVAQSLKQRSYKVTLHRAEITPVSEIETNKLFVFATSTWEHGRINPFFDKLLSAISDLEAGSLANKQAAFIGLGDKRYEPVLFCQGIETLKQALTSKGISQVGDTLKINGDPHGLLDTIVKDWVATLKYE